MDYFIRKLGLFLLVPVTIVALIETTISLTKYRIFDEALFDKRFKQDANAYTWINLLEIDTLHIIAGSSSARYGLSCTVLNALSDQNIGYASIAMDARDPIQTYFLLKNIDLNKVRKIYFSLDPWIYSKRYYRLRDKYLYLDFDIMESFAYAKEHDTSTFTKRYMSFFSFLFDWSENPVPINTRIPDDYGSVPLTRTAINFTDMGDWFQLEDYGWSELQFDYLAKIERLLNSKGIPLSLFVAPKRSDYTAYYLKNNRGIHDEFMSKLEEKGIHSPIFGKFDLMEKHGDSTLFAEAYHLNEKGQIEFSKLFHQLSQEKHRPYSKDYSWFIDDQKPE